MARGKFKDVQIQGAQRMPYKGFNAFGTEQSGVLFLDNSTAVAGATSDLHKLVDERSQSSYGMPVSLKQKLSAAGSNNQVWAVFSGGLQRLNFGLPADSNAGQLIQVFRGLDSGVAGIDLRDGFSFAAQLDGHTANDAKHVRDAIKGVIGLGRLSTPDNQPDLLKLYDAIQVDLDGQQVRINAKIAPALEDRFLDLWLGKR